MNKKEEMEALAKHYNDKKLGFNIKVEEKEEQCDLSVDSNGDKPNKEAQAILDKWKEQGIDATSYTLSESGIEKGE